MFQRSETFAEGWTLFLFPARVGVPNMTSPEVTLGRNVPWSRGVVQRVDNGHPCLRLALPYRLYTNYDE